MAGLAYGGKPWGIFGSWRVLTSVTAKRRKSWLLAASALASSSLGISEPALAQCTGPADNTICTPGGNDYPSGINVSTSNTAIKVTLEPGVRVVIPNGSPIANAVNLSNTTAPFTPEADATLTVNSAFIDNTLTFSAPNKSGLRIQASGNATITATDTEVRVTGAQSTNAIWAIVLQSSNPNSAATVNYNGPGVTSSGSSCQTVIQAVNDGPGDAFIEARGDLRGFVVGSGHPLMASLVCLPPRREAVGPRTTPAARSPCVETLQTKFTRLASRLLSPPLQAPPSRS